MGSSEINGANAVQSDQLGDGKYNIASGKLCYPQDSESDMAKILNQLTPKEAIFSLFVPARNEDVVWEKNQTTKKHNHDYYQYVGEKQFVGNGGYHERDELEDLIEEAEKFGVEKQDECYLTFRRMPHIRHRFRDFDQRVFKAPPSNLRIKIEKQRTGKYAASAGDKLGFIVGHDKSWKSQLSLEEHVEPHAKLCEVFFGEDGDYKDFLDADSPLQQSVNGSSNEKDATEDEDNYSSSKKRTVTVPELVDMMAHNVVAASARGLRMNLVDRYGDTLDSYFEGSPMATILYQEEFEQGLAGVMRGACMPAAARSRDVTTAWLINCYLNTVEKTGLSGVTKPPSGAAYQWKRANASDLPKDNKG